MKLKPMQDKCSLHRLCFTQNNLSHLLKGRGAKDIYL